MKLIKALISVLLLTNLCFANAYDDGLKALKSGDKEKALALFKQSKNPLALMNVGVFYTQQKDYKEALNWYVKAAELGDPVAQAKTGSLYERGIGTKADYRKAAEWFYKAAKQGSAMAQHNLANMYMDGRGVKESHEKAFKLYTLASKQGMTFSMYKLARMYRDGIATKQDYQEAAKWYQKAVDGRDTNSALELGMLYYQGTGLKKDQPLAFKYIEFSARAGNKKAQDRIKKICKENSELSSKFTCKHLDVFDKKAADTK
ncbi:Putative beta-lactamase HcpC precursor [Vibrio aerogenes CECT 7868]|uniref:Putative beta-lactamase HcpC n=1 Tax=Vibrio aerogenes CECT 7868 TaxID=1216006 RepID=A0A1M5ZFL6_9VIBR|nr:tetratricopeptide repeat protein [Vibrio aerogenes]SHI22989.1 Putative beta-lactamase HcpC precursor [Vibrio aerogenes CECT 7868]